MNIKKLNVDPVKTAIYSGVALIVIAGSIYAFFFLYNSFYNTLTSSQKVKVLQEEWNVEPPNIDRFQEIKEQLKRKSENRKAEISIDFN